MLNIYTDEEIKIMEESRQTMIEFKERHSSIPTKTEKIRQQIKSYDHGKDVFEQYDSVKSEGKIKIDLIYLEQLTKNVDNSMKELLHESVSNLFRVVDEIYEHINVEPEIYGANVDTDLLNESMDIMNKKVTEVLEDYFKNHFYRLTSGQRYKKFYESHKNLATQLVENGMEVKDSVEYSVKQVVVENLLHRICFPYGPWSRIKNLSESEEYGEIFDQEKLIDLMNTYESDREVVSKIIATGL